MSSCDEFKHQKRSRHLGASILKVVLQIVSPFMLHAFTPLRTYCDDSMECLIGNSLAVTNSPLPFRVVMRISHHSSFAVVHNLPFLSIDLDEYWTLLSHLVRLLC